MVPILPALSLFRNKMGESGDWGKNSINTGMEDWAPVEATYWLSREKLSTLLLVFLLGTKSPSLLSRPRPNNKHWTLVDK